MIWEGFYEISHNQAEEIFKSKVLSEQIEVFGVDYEGHEALLETLEDLSRFETYVVEKKLAEYVQALV